MLKTLNAWQNPPDFWDKSLGELIWEKNWPCETCEDDDFDHHPSNSKAHKVLYIYIKIISYVILRGSYFW